MGKLDGKVAFITGAASGLGKAQAALFVKEGAKVVLADLNFEGMKTLAEELSEAGENTLPVQVNVTDRASVQEAVRQSLEKFNTINILSNTAGAFDGMKNLLDTNDELWEKVVNVNLNSLYIVTQEVLPIMLKQKKGNIISISSGAGLVGGGGGISYTSTKHAVIGFTKQIAADYGSEGIRSNAICPGLITTPMTNELTSNPDFVKYIESLPGGRIGVPEDIAKAALFLASDDSDYIHGVALPVDGGLVAK